MPTYIIPVTCDLGKTLPSVGEVVDSVNDFMEAAHFHEKMVVRSEIVTMTLTTERELTHEEKLKVQASMQESYDEKIPDKDLRVADPCEWR